MSLVMNLLCQNVSILVADTRLSGETPDSVVVFSDNSQKAIQISPHVAVAFTGDFPLAAVIKQYALAQRYPDFADVVATDLLHFVLCARERYRGVANFIVTGRTSIGRLATFSFKSDSCSRNLKEEWGEPYNISLHSYGAEDLREHLPSAVDNLIATKQDLTDNDLIACMKDHLRLVSSHNKTVGPNAKVIKIVLE